MKRVLLTFLLSSFICTLAQAETQYVSDQLTINLRTGTSTGHRIIRTLKSGDALLVKERSENGYALVKHLRTGDEGWVLSRQLMKTPHAKSQLKKLNDEVRALQEQQLQKSSTNKELTSKNTALSKSSKDLEARNKQLKAELDRIRRISENAEKTQENYNALIATSKKDKNRINDLVVEIDQLKADSDKQWFMLGACVLFFGLLLGLIIPKIRFQKRSSWSSL